MSIFFYQAALALFPLCLALSFIQTRNHLKAVFLPAICGIIFGFMCFGLFAISAQTSEAKIFFYALCIASLAALPISLKLKNFYFLAAVSFLLAVCYGFDYRLISMNFKIFAGELLDSLSLTNLFMLCLAFLILTLLYFILKLLLRRIDAKIKSCFFILVCVALILDRLGFLGLSLMQEGHIKTYSELLSVIAKAIYYDSFLPIIFSIVALILAAISLKQIPSPSAREGGVIKFRQNKALRFCAFREFFIVLILGFILSGFSLYFILVASKPPKIDEPTIVEPVNSEFKFDANLVLDNKLHRFAYVTDDGHKVRFFLLNRFADKLAPVAVFDACSICGDMGYVKKEDELICIACNVRIFLPSVGKPGGCNPIPFDYKFDGKSITIALKTIEDGASFFSEIVEKEVTDPVSRKKIKNSSKFTYLYYGRNYYFENEANEAEFIKNPEIYVTTEGVLKELK